MWNPHTAIRLSRDSFPKFGVFFSQAVTCCMQTFEIDERLNFGGTRCGGSSLPYSARRISLQMLSPLSIATVIENSTGLTGLFRAFFVTHSLTSLRYADQPCSNHFDPDNLST